MNIYSKRPTLFERSSGNIWTDPYIQKQMLTEHLNPETDGASRKSESRHKIIDLIHRSIKPQSRILDLGCGPGLYANCLYEKGHQITGIDFNRISIEYASKENSRIDYRYGDYLHNYPEEIFDCVMMVYCDMGTHSDTDRDHLLSKIYHSLESGGIFIFDVFTEQLIQERWEKRDWNYNPQGGFWNETAYLIISEIFHYPEAHAFATQYNLLTGKENKHFILWDRYYSQEEIRDVLKKIGFKDITIHLNITSGNNFTSSNEMFIVAHK